MRFIELGFQLGVVFAIFGFIWGIFQIGIAFIRGIRPKTMFEEYLLKFLQYLFLVDVTFLFCLDRENEGQLADQEVWLTAFILLMYFIGKLQQRQTRLQVFRFSGLNFPENKPLFNLSLEISAILAALILFVLFMFFPSYARNPLSVWFYENITEIEQTFFFGFIFKIIGFFVLLSLLMKMINGISYLLSGAPLMTVKSKFGRGNHDQDSFDDFEELN